MNELGLLLPNWPDGVKEKVKEKIYEYLCGVDCDMICKAVSPLYNIVFNAELINDCIENNYFNVLKYVRKIDKKTNVITNEYWSNAIAKGNLEIFDYLVKLDPNGYTHIYNTPRRLRCLRAACSNGHIDLLNYLISLSPEDLRNINLCQYAPISNRIDVLEHVVNLGCVPDMATFDNVAKAGNIDMLNWLVARDYKSINFNTFTVAALQNNFDMIKMLYKICNSKKITWISNEITNAAALIGNLDMLVWLMGRGCTASYQIVSNATQSGSLSILQYAYNITPKTEDRVQHFHKTFLINQTVTGRATDVQTIQILEWFNSIGFSTYTTEATHGAIRKDKHATMEYLLSHACPLPVHPLLLAMQYEAIATGIRLAQLYGFTPADILTAKSNPILKPLLDYFTASH